MINPSAPPQAFPPSPGNDRSALAGLAGNPSPEEEMMMFEDQKRSGMAYMAAAQKMLQAAMDELPMLSPAINAATGILAQGLTALSNPEQAMAGPVAYPPGPEQYDPSIEAGQPEMDPYSDPSASPENIYMPELM